jgi:hypothetical protein
MLVLIAASSVLISAAAEYHAVHNKTQVRQFRFGAAFEDTQTR